LLSSAVLRPFSHLLRSLYTYNYFSSTFSCAVAAVIIFSVPLGINAEKTFLKHFHLRHILTNIFSNLSLQTFSLYLKYGQRA